MMSLMSQTPLHFPPIVVKDSGKTSRPNDIVAFKSCNSDSVNLDVESFISPHISNPNAVLRRSTRIIKKNLISLLRNKANFIFFKGKD